ncbi:unnamed protein product [Lampetra fluviatilis]
MPSPRGRQCGIKSHLDARGAEVAAQAKQKKVWGKTASEKEKRSSVRGGGGGGGGIHVALYSDSTDESSSDDEEEEAVPQRASQPTITG